MNKDIFLTNSFGNKKEKFVPINSKKIGMYLPGTKIKIVEEKIQNLKKYDYLLIFSWHIKKDLIKVLKKKGYKGKFIIPLPKPRII